MDGETNLVRLAAGGDTAAFEQLVAAYEKPVYSLALRMVGNAEDAMDLSQEAFLKAWRGLGAYRSDASFSTWLYRLTSNVCIDFLRRQKRQKVVPLQYEDDEEQRELSLPDPSPGPEAQAMARLERRQVEEALDQLEPEYRQALLLRVMEGRAYGEIAEILGIPEGTVKSRIARAREKMRTALQKNGNKRRQKSSKETK